ncbi:MAG: tRNA guanosine(15) transglycosylase TgtA [Candidatus Helarchaeales archaeon]
MFEIRDKDGLGRIGRLKTAHGFLETPNLLPVYNPNIPLIEPKEMKKTGMTGLITNAYIIYNTPRLKERAGEGIHEIISFDGIIMTDSGAYQSWMYKEELEVSNREIVEFQDLLRPDIATMLDIFTDTDLHEEAEKGVMITYERGIEALEIRKSDSGILWAGPIQGGQFTDLVKRSARLMSSLPFDYHPVGTLAPALMSYNYKQVVSQIITARLNMNQGRPLHAFSIGHPMFFALAVACGADIFDSSAYALFAKNDRYLLPSGTFRLDRLQEFPCSCPVCTNHEPRELRNLPQEKKQSILALHNLYISFQELKMIRQAIREGKLWELVQTRASVHPSLMEAFRHVLKNFQVELEQFELRSKESAFFLINSASMDRPEIYRYQKRIREIKIPEVVEVLLLVPEFPTNEINIKFHEKLESLLFKEFKEHRHRIQVIYISPIFGIILEDLKNVYPLIQNKYPIQTCNEIFPFVKKLVQDFLNTSLEKGVHLFLYNPSDFEDPDLSRYGLELELFKQVAKEFGTQGNLMSNQEDLKTQIKRIFKNRT